MHKTIFSETSSQNVYINSHTELHHSKHNQYRSNDTLHSRSIFNYNTIIHKCMSSLLWNWLSFHIFTIYIFIIRCKLVHFANQESTSIYSETGKTIKKIELYFHISLLVITYRRKVSTLTMYIYISNRKKEKNV